VAALGLPAGAAAAAAAAAAASSRVCEAVASCREFGSGGL